MRGLAIRILSPRNFLVPVCTQGSRPAQEGFELCKETGIFQEERQNELCSTAKIVEIQTIGNFFDPNPNKEPAFLSSRLIGRYKKRGR